MCMYIKLINYSLSSHMYRYLCACILFALYEMCEKEQLRFHHSLFYQVLARKICPKERECYEGHNIDRNVKDGNWRHCETNKICREMRCSCKRSQSHITWVIIKNASSDSQHFWHIWWTPAWFIQRQLVSCLSAFWHTYPKKAHLPVWL